MKYTKTNGDKLRAMTDEELAQIVGFNECKDEKHQYECTKFGKTHCDGECRKHFLEWLKQEAQEC